MKASELLDGKSNVSSEELVLNMIKSALLTLEDKGNIEFKIIGNHKNEKDKWLLIKPVDKDITFPKKTLEYRLNPREVNTVKTIVAQWLIDESIDPWNRAVDQGKIMLVLRGLATVNTAEGRKYKYSKLGLEKKDTESSKIEQVKNLLNNCREQRPEIWRLLDQQITLAFTDKTLSPKRSYKQEERNPWLNESEEDQHTFFQSYNIYKPQKYSYIISAIIGIGFGLLWYYVIPQFLYDEISIQKQYNLAYSIATVLALIFILSRLKFKPLVFLLKDIENLIPEKYTRYLVKDQTNFQYVCSSIPGVTVFGFLLHLIILKIQESPMIAIGLLGVVGYFAYKQLQKKTRKAINKSVLGDFRAEETKIDKVEKFTLDTESKPVEDLASEYEKYVQLEIVRADEIPNTSKESLKRFENISLRGPSYFKLVRKILLYFSSVTFIIAIVYWLFFGTNSPLKSDESFEISPYFVFLIVFYLITIAMINSRSSAWIKGFVVKIFISFGAKLMGFDLKSDIDAIKTDESKTLRPIELLILFWIWLILAIYITNNRYANLAGPKIVPYVLVLSSLLIIAGFFFWLIRSRIKIEKQYPYYPPINMLALRVFGSPFLTNFLVLTNSWKWFGTTQRLDGPGTAGYRESDVLNYLFGRIDKSIVEDDKELSLALRNFRTKADKKLRFPLNSMQCTNATWKNALQKLLDKADLVVMDLSHLSAQNQGVVYEIQKLFDQFNKERIVFLINDSTDLKVLEKIVNEAWNQKSNDSPNIDEKYTRITLYHTGVIPSINKGESIYDWNKRFETQIDGNQLVRLLFDRSQPPIKSAILPDSKKEKRAIRWTKISIPSWIKVFIKVAIAIYFIIEMISIISKLGVSSEFSQN